VRGDAIEAVWREHGVRLLAVLARDLRSLDVAEEALQEAQVAALRQWPADGVPANPAGWLRTVALRRGRDRLRRDATLARKLPLLVVDDVEPDDAEPDAVSPIADERLRLVFTACHPALAMPARVALTLRYAAGLTTAEIARLFLVPVPAMAARITRAKRKIAAAGVPYRVPADADLPDRLAGVLAVVYLVFTEGYLPASGDRLVRVELCAEAIRLGGLLADLLPDEPEVLALLALMRLQHARRDARTDAGGLVRLADQDRGRWHAEEIAAGLAELERAARRRAPGPYAIQAAIAAEHASAATAAATDWPAIAALYGQLERVAPTPAVRLNRAIAVAEAGEPERALARLEGLDGPLAGRHELPAARAELLARLGRTAAARRAYDDAVALAGNTMVRAHLAATRARLDC
jgi:RNA polymerase sigma-70 factor (ECF subfamily)